MIKKLTFITSLLVGNKKNLLFLIKPASKFNFLSFFFIPNKEKTLSALFWCFQHDDLRETDFCVASYTTILSMLVFTKTFNRFKVWYFHSISVISRFVNFGFLTYLSIALFIIYYDLGIFQKLSWWYAMIHYRSWEKIMQLFWGFGS
jgi:hypothetical protein